MPYLHFDSDQIKKKEIKKKKKFVFMSVYIMNAEKYLCKIKHELEFVFYVKTDVSPPIVAWLQALSLVKVM